MSAHPHAHTPPTLAERVCAALSAAAAAAVEAGLNALIDRFAPQTAAARASARAHGDVSDVGSFTLPDEEALAVHISGYIPPREVTLYARFSDCPHCGSAGNRRWTGEFGLDYSHEHALLQLLCFALQDERDEPVLDPHPPGQPCAHTRGSEAQ